MMNRCTVTLPSFLMLFPFPRLIHSFVTYKSSNASTFPGSVGPAPRGEVGGGVESAFSPPRPMWVYRRSDAPPPGRRRLPSIIFIILNNQSPPHHVINFPRDKDYHFRPFYSFVCRDYSRHRSRDLIQSNIHPFSLTLVTSCLTPLAR